MLYKHWTKLLCVKGISPGDKVIKNYHLTLQPLSFTAHWFNFLNHSFIVLAYSHCSYISLLYGTKNGQLAYEHNGVFSCYRTVLFPFRI